MKCFKIHLLSEKRRKTKSSSNSLKCRLVVVLVTIEFIVPSTLNIVLPLNGMNRYRRLRVYVCLQMRQRLCSCLLGSECAFDFVVVFFRSFRMKYFSKPIWLALSIANDKIRFVRCVILCVDLRINQMYACVCLIWWQRNDKDGESERGEESAGIHFKVDEKFFG